MSALGSCLEKFGTLEPRWAYLASARIRPTTNEEAWKVDPRTNTVYSTDSGRSENSFRFGKNTPLEALDLMLNEKCGSRRRRYRIGQCANLQHGGQGINKVSELTKDTRISFV